MRPEDKVLLACANAVLSSDRCEVLGVIGPDGLNWPLLLEVARAQRVVALCYPALQQLGPKGAPAKVLAAFRAGAMTTAARNLRLAAKLVEIVACADRAEIPLIPYKGPTLAEMAYGNLGLREFVDLDFIVPHIDLRRAWDALVGLGYRPVNPALAASNASIPGEYIFLSPEGEVQVEVHTELTLRHFPTPPDLARLIAAREPVTIAGCRIQTFSRENMLTLLAVHGAKDFWAQLLWVCDIAALCRISTFDWDRALEMSERMGCRRMVHVALLLALNMLEAPIPGDFERQAEADIVAQRQAAWIGARLLNACPIGRWDQLRYRMRMVDGFWPGVRYATRLATTPAAADWKALPLPAPFGFAYALLRPLRLFRR